MIRHHIAVWSTGPKVGIVRDIALGLVAFTIAIWGTAADPAVMVAALAILWAAGHIVTTTLLPARPAVASRASRPRGRARPPAAPRGHRAPCRPLGWRRHGAPKTGRPVPGWRAGLPTPAAAPPASSPLAPAAAGQTPVRAGLVGRSSSPIHYQPGRAAVST
jgi:hypothetical protein